MDFFSEDTDQYEFFLHITLKWALWDIKKSGKKPSWISNDKTSFEFWNLQSNSSTKINHFILKETF